MFGRLFRRQPTTDVISSEPAEKGRWHAGLTRTRQGLGQQLKALLGGHNPFTDDLRDELEMTLLAADVGIETTKRLLDRLAADLQQHPGSNLMERLAQQMVDTLDVGADTPQPSGTQKPRSILIVGVNGVGKTTTIGKLAHRYKSEGAEVILAAGDTFRAAAIDQLQVWGERNGVPVIAQQPGSDSASVIFDALQSAQRRQADILIADTAGRLHNKSHLMEELAKVVRVMRKLDSSAPHEILLVVDASTGQNAVSQAREFNKATPLSGIVVTKLDGTARGGVVLALADQLQIPVRYVGLGEGIGDLRPFDPVAFVEALLEA